MHLVCGLHVPQMTEEANKKCLENKQSSKSNTVQSDLFHCKWWQLGLAGCLTSGYAQVAQVCEETQGLFIFASTAAVVLVLTSKVVHQNVIAFVKNKS